MFKTPEGDRIQQSRVPPKIERKRRPVCRQLRFDTNGWEFDGEDEIAGGLVVHIIPHTSDVC